MMGFSSKTNYTAENKGVKMCFTSCVKRLRNLFSEYEFFYTTEVSRQNSAVVGSCQTGLFTRGFWVVTWTLRWLSCVTVLLTLLFCLYLLPEVFQINPFITQPEWELPVSWNDQPLQQLAYPEPSGKVFWIEWNSTRGCFYNRFIHKWLSFLLKYHGDIFSIHYRVPFLKQLPRLTGR